MKQIWICCAALLSVVLTGCAGSQQAAQKAEPQEQGVAQQEIQDQESEVPLQVNHSEFPAESETGAEDDAFTGRWQAVESLQYYMDISSNDGGYTLEIVWSDASRGDIVWRVTGTYDEDWGGIAYTGTKYEDVVKEDGTIDSIPVPEREAVSGMVYLKDEGTLHWIDDFDHAGDDLSFVKE